MTQKLLIAAMALCVPFAAFAADQRVELVTTDRADVAAGALIRIEASAGELSVEAWDEPAVQITTTRYTWSASKDKQRFTEALGRIHVEKTAVNPQELRISTSRRHSLDIHLDYRIMVPRSSRLAITHGVGDVLIYGVAGSIDAVAKGGDILVQLPDPGSYEIHAKTRLGSIYSDFSDPSHPRLSPGETLIIDSPAGTTAAHINLRTAIGGITIQKTTGWPPSAAGSL